MAKNVSNNQTLEEFRQSYNSLVDEVGGIGALRTSQKGSLVDSINSIIDQYFFFQDFEYDGSDGSSSNRTFSGADNFGETLQYSVNRLLVFKNGTLLRSGTDYSATNGTSITLSSSAANSDVIRITSFTGSYEGVAGATQAATTQWTKTGAGSIYNHDTTGGVVINADDTGVVTAPPSGVGVQIESDGADIFLNAGGSSNKVDVNANLSLRSGMKLQKAGGNIAIGDIQGLESAVKGLFSGGTGISFADGVISATGTSDTTGNAGTATALQNARTIHGVSFDGTANIDLSEVIQDTVGAMFDGNGSGSTTVTYNDNGSSAGTVTVSSTGKTQEEIEDIVGAMFTTTNTETGINVIYQDGTGDIDLVIEDDSIVSSMIADNTIVGGNIAANTIGSSEIAANAINASELADNSVDTAAIVNDAVTLGTKTSGDYVGGLQAGTGLSTTGASSGEGIAHSISLDDTAVSAGSYGSASAIPTFTVDAQGRLTAASSVSVDTYSGFNFGASSSDRASVAETNNVHITGASGSNISTDHAVNSGTHTLSIDIKEAHEDDANTKGIAKFDTTDFSVSSGTVNLVQARVEDIVGAMVSGGGATSVSYNTSTNSLVISSTDDNTITSIREDSGSYRTGNITLQSGTNVTITEPSTGVFNIESTDTNTTYSVGDGGLTAVNFTTARRDKLAGIATNANNYTLPADNITNASLSNGNQTLTLTKNNGTTVALTNTDTNTTYVASDFMGTATPNIAAKFSSLGVGVNASGTTGKIDASNDIVAYSSSDIALKENINPISNALDKVMSLGGYTFNWKKDRDEEHGYGNSLDVGILAQEVESVLPTAVRENNYGNKAVRYEKLIPLLLESIKELKKEIQSLKS